MKRSISARARDVKRLLEDFDNSTPEGREKEAEDPKEKDANNQAWKARQVAKKVARKEADGSREVTGK
ncbi:hypothetical protein N7509_012991 [Penicillium cosmopolitanum]|uniref:Uncharacterized protein n=1 Tax=Penicillium cosmopolitanum TaxID=1131564 RepID=A0A9W9VE21_9EURO|nr:uncharacterized protein N7509_012991 [Penicillium cosmopolitanum]KAJ5376105.1 hypothetical protein N7509_012991 [Penicillium cosmopolitanum]